MHRPEVGYPPALSSRVGWIVLVSSRVERAMEGGAAMLFLPREGGQGLVEYALILLFIAIVVVAVLLIFGPAVGNLYSVVVHMWPTP